MPFCDFLFPPVILAVPETDLNGIEMLGGVKMWVWLESETAFFS